MKNMSTESLLQSNDTWRILEAEISEANSIHQPNKEAEKKLEAVRTTCLHGVYVHLTTEYVDDGLGDPDFHSSYRCLCCGSTAYDIPAFYGAEPKNYCINMTKYESSKKYSNDEKFGIAEYLFRRAIKKHPDYSIKQIITIVNQKIAKK